MPTLDEQGVNDYEVNAWRGYFAPAGTPPEIEGQNLTVERRVAANKLELVPGLAAELAKLNANVIVTYR
jgi:hypothetical protein